MLKHRFLLEGNLFYFIGASDYDWYHPIGDSESESPDFLKYYAKELMQVVESAGSYILENWWRQLVILLAIVVAAFWVGGYLYTETLPGLFRRRNGGYERIPDLERGHRPHAD